MIVIVANQGDESARLLAARWSEYGALLLSPRDLSTSGWLYNPIATEANAAVIGRRLICSSEITGVLTRLPWVSQYELTHIVPDDRAYVASEMNAFLLALLDGLACPLLNRPTPACLSGPGWRNEQWVHCAARLRIPVCPVRRQTGRLEGLPPAGSGSASKIVTVVGHRCFGDAGATLADRARQLAAAAGVDLLAVHFQDVNGEFRLLNADFWPDINSADVADAIFDYFREGRLG
jgi:hypothetical protein